MSDDTLLERLWKVANFHVTFDDRSSPDRQYLTIEAVARGLERMRGADNACGSHQETFGGLGEVWCDACWANMLDAFLSGCSGSEEQKAAKP